MKYRYLFTKPYVFELIRGVVLCYLLKILLKNNERLEYIRQNLYTLYSIDAQGNRFFSFVKCILLFSIFILGFYRSLIFLSELSEDYYKCVKYRSKHRYHYLWNRTKLQFHFFFTRYVCLDSRFLLYSFLYSNSAYTSYGVTFIEFFSFVVDKSFISQCFNDISIVCYCHFRSIVFWFKSMGVCYFC